MVKNRKKINYTQRSSMSQLYALGDALNLTNSLFICNREMLNDSMNNPYIRFIILNLDPIGNGTHWVAIDKKRRLYFDSYALPPPLGIPKSYKRASTIKELQSIDSSMCGQLCILWCYYMKNKSNEEYYRLFKDVY